MKTFLSQLGFIGVIGLAVIAHHWLNTRKGEKITYGYSYRRVLWRFMKWFGTLYATTASLMTLFVVADLLGLTHFGYPWWALPVAIVMAAIGCGVRVLFKSFLDYN